MGVPGMFSKLVKTFSREILQNRLPIAVDNLYLDLNCAIHPAVKQSSLTLEEMPEAVLTYLKNIVNYANPTKTIFIAIDGVAPYAKMLQQRRRRFKSKQDEAILSKIRDKHNIKNPHEGIDFNMISPGTVFMKNLSDYLLTNIKRLHKDHPNWKGRNIIFSDWTVPGEGENKLTEYIRNNNAESHVIYGLDADLIFLCLSNYRNNMFLLRESQYFDVTKGNYLYLSVDKLREHLINILKSTTSITDIQDIFNVKFNIETIICSKSHCIDEQRLIMDYTFLCFFLGNDFLPHIPSLKIRDNGLDYLVYSYKLAQAKLHRYLVNTNKTVDLVFLKEILKYLSSVEDDVLQHMTTQQQMRIKNFYSSNKYKNANEYEREIMEFEYAEDKIVDTIKFGYDGWKLRYYSTADKLQQIATKPTELQSESRRIQIAQDYFNGLHWVLHYYTNSTENWTWCYEHGISPCISDLYTLLDKLEIPKFIKTTHLTPFEQLLSILPPESSGLLPYPLDTLLTNYKSPIIHLYPREFRLDMMGTHRWECNPILPKQDLMKISNVCKQYLKYVNKKDLERNNIQTIIQIK
jgi:5'-3' exonuclease